MQLVAFYQWRPRPVVTLEQEGIWGQVIWHAGAQSRSFSGRPINVLTLQVQFKYKNPYGGHADYHVFIDRLSGSAWSSELMDTVSYLTDGPDDVWHTQTKDYSLQKHGLGSLDFRVGVSVQVGGSLPTNGGGTGSWLPLAYRQFTARFGRPRRWQQYISQYLAIQQEYWNRSAAEYRRRSRGR
jgi:hypothetical protein